MKNHMIRKPILLGADRETSRFQVDFFGQVYGKRAAAIPMTRSHAIAFADKRCDHAYKKLKVPDHPRVADDLIREAGDRNQMETRILYSIKESSPPGRRPVVHFDPSGWIPLSGDPDFGWFGLVIPGKYACLLHGPSYAARIFGR